MLTDIRQFRKGLRALSELRRSGALRFIAGIPGVVPTKIELLEGGEHGEHFRRKLDSVGLKRAEFDEVVAEVADVLEGILSGVDVDEWTRNAVPAGSDIDAESRIRDKRDLVSKEFSEDIRTLRDRTWIKATAKTEIVNSVSWDVSLKHGTDADDKPHESPVPYAILQITAMPTVDFGSLKERTVTVTLDDEDIQYLLDTLERLYAAYGSMSKRAKRDADRR